MNLTALLITIAIIKLIFFWVEYVERIEKIESVSDLIRAMNYKNQSFDLFINKVIMNVSQSTGIKKELLTAEIPSTMTKKG